MVGQIDVLMALNDIGEGDGTYCSDSGQPQVYRKFTLD